MKRLTLVLALLLSSAVVLQAGTLPVKVHELLSPVYTIDKKYRSMEGPGNLDTVYLGDRETPELLWLVGVKTEMVGADGRTPQLPELMCHVNLDYDSNTHRQLFGLQRAVGSRVMTLSQGVLGVRLPDGFGFPVASNEPLTLFTQVLNHNIAEPKNLQVRHRVTFEYVRERDAPGAVKPLINIGASGTVFLDHDPNAIPTAVDIGGSAHGQSCLMAPKAPNAAPGMASEYVDPEGRKVTGHWVVPPGQQTNQSDVTWFMALPFDAKLHYAAVHLHPFAQSLTLRDATAKQNLVTARALNPKGRVGLDHVDTFVSREGVPLYRNHKYEVISVYNNTTEETHDSMASIFLGVDDAEFVKPSAEDLANREADTFSAWTNTATVRTSAGSFVVRLLRTTSPRPAHQFARLVKAGNLQGGHVIGVEENARAFAVTFDLPAWNLGRIAAESKSTMEAGSVAMCPGATDGSVTLKVFLQTNADADGRCTVFGKIEGSLETILKIVTAPRDEQGKPREAVEITKGELTELRPAGMLQSN
jgi:cyclophilin family peptidyl-prolyl cis-trans isomerase